MRHEISVRHRLVLGIALKSALLATAAWGSLGAAQAQTVAAASQVETVIVTGDRGRERTVTNSPTPVDVLAGNDIEQAGQSSVLAALDTLIPSFNEPARAGGSTATIIQTGGLRGLNPDQTLVLVDGKRRHKTSLINAVSSLYNGSVPVDLDMIPASSIDHIEVLRDGAAALYGSDAIAGVINIILKHDNSGAELSATGGQNYDRNDGQLYSSLGHIGFDLGGKGYLNLSGSTRYQLASNRALPVASTLALYNTVGGAADPREATINRLVTTNYGALPQRTIDTGYDAAYTLNNGIELYSFGTLSHRISDLNLTFRAPNNSASLPEVYPNGFHPAENISELDYDATLGARGEIGGWKWDLSSSYGLNRAKLRTEKSINASLGPTSPTQFYDGTLASNEWVNSLDFTRGFDWNGSLVVSAGLQHRRESYSIRPGDTASSAAGTYVIPAGQGNAGARPAPGAQGFAGITPSDAGQLHRNNVAAYVDVSYDPTPNLNIGVAGRVEHYGDASGDTVVGKINARYALTPWLAVRAAVNNGFRAPALAQEMWATTTGQFQIVGGALTLLQIKSLPVSSASAIALGAKPLQPETSLNYSAGLVLTPLDNLEVTVDGYSIDVYNRIEPTGTFTGTAVSNILTANGLPSNISATYFTNAINTRTQGVDLVASYKIDLGDWGFNVVNLGGNYGVTSITRIAANPPQLASLGASYVIFDRIAQGNLTVLPPKSKISIGDTWNLGDFTLISHLTRYGSYTIRQTAAANDRSFNAKWIENLELDWQATQTLGLAVGADDLLNTYPSANGIFNTATGSQQYGGSPPSPFGFTGGYYYGRVSIKL